MNNESKQEVLALGLMSGTSMDGIDAALIRTDGRNQLTCLKQMSRPYDVSERQVLEKAVLEAARLDSLDVANWTDAIHQADALVTKKHIEFVKEFMGQFSLSTGDLRIVGFHGQTIAHRPDKGVTVQIGNGQKLAAACGIDVVYDLRGRDVAAGGQGAPLVPIYHQCLVRQAGIEGPVVVVNIGGIANVTWIHDDGSESGGHLLAFDTGPGNVLLDRWMQAQAGEPFDDNGQCAASGEVNQKVLKTLLQRPYFHQRPPKSLDRLDFDLAALTGLDLADGAATLAEFTAESLAMATSFFPEEPKQWIVCGGGANNGWIMQRLRDRLSGEVRTGAELGWEGDFIEAQAFAYLAVRHLSNLPITFPGTTAVPAAMSGGQLAAA